MKKSMVFAVVGLLLVVGLLGLVKFLQINDLISASAAMVPPPPSVATSRAQLQQWETTLNAVGSLQAVQGVTVSADIPGRVSQISFTAGTDVQAGALLIQQDISSEQAQLRAAQANVELARASLQRVRELVNKNVASQAELDTAEARNKEAVAQADAIQTTIEKKSIRAPFAGRLGIRLVNLGQDLASGTPIVSLQEMDQLYVNFSLPQQTMQHLNLGLPVRVSSDAVPDAVFDGRITAIDPEVDQATRTVRVQATLDNQAERLLPGMYADVAVVLPETEAVLAVPATAVAYATFGDSVFVVEAEQDDATGETQQVVRQQFVQLGRHMGDFVAIEKGLEAEQEVVTSGVFKLRNGSPVDVNNEVKPDYQLHPQPDDA